MNEKNYSLQINTGCFKNGMPILRIKSLSNPVCKKRRLFVCPLYFSPEKHRIKRIDSKKLFIKQVNQANDEEI